MSDAGAGAGADADADAEQLALAVLDLASDPSTSIEVVLLRWSRPQLSAAGSIMHENVFIQA